MKPAGSNTYSLHCDSRASTSEPQNANDERSSVAGGESPRPHRHSDGPVPVAEEEDPAGSGPAETGRLLLCALHTYLISIFLRMWTHFVAVVPCVLILCTIFILNIID